MFRSDAGLGNSGAICPVFAIWRPAARRPAPLRGWLSLPASGWACRPGCGACARPMRAMLPRAGSKQRLPRRKCSRPKISSSCSMPEAARCAADAGLLSSCARLPASLPSALSFSDCCSMRVTSRERSSRMLTTRCVMEGIAANIAGTVRFVRRAHVGAVVDTPRPPRSSSARREAGSVRAADEHHRPGPGAVALYLHLTLQQDGHGISGLALFEDSNVRVDKPCRLPQATDILHRLGRLAARRSAELL